MSTSNHDVSNRKMSEFYYAVEIFGISLIVFEIFNKELGYSGEKRHIFYQKIAFLSSNGRFLQLF